MYREKFSVRLTSGEATITEIVMPPGKMKNDEFFGDQEIYTGRKVIHALVDRNANPGAIEVVVEVVGQGCNEPVGVCYPPHKQNLEITLPANQPAAATAPAANPIAALSNLGKSLGISSGGDDDFLEPDKAFQLTVTNDGSNTVRLDFTAAKDYYL